jgi:hypothetical protein
MLGKSKIFLLRLESVLMYTATGTLYIPDIKEIKDEIFYEAYDFIVGRYFRKH